MKANTPILESLLQYICKEQMGFLDRDQLDMLARHDRLRLVLVRCACGRFLAAAQDVEHFTEMVKRDEVDYVRDLSLPSSDPAYQGIYAKVTQDPPEPQPQRYRLVIGPEKTAIATRVAVRNDFNENDCGGVFDGFGVTSDADPGL